MNTKPLGQYGNGFPNQNNQQNNFINQGGMQLMNNYMQLNSNYKELEQKFKNIKNRNKIYYKDIKKQDEYISNYKNFINELNNELNNFHDQLNISVFGKKLEENLINKQENAKLLKELDGISYKINQLSSIIEAQNRELKNVEINYKVIQEKLNEIKENENNDENTKQKVLLINNDIISYNLEELEETSKHLEYNKNLYERKKVEIKQDIKRIQNITNKKVKEIKIKRKNSFKNFNLTEKQNNQMNDPLFLKGSMLLTI